MTRYFLAALIVGLALFVSGQSLGQETKKKENGPELNLGELKIGQKGRMAAEYSIGGGRLDYWLEVDEVLSDKEVLIRLQASPRVGATKLIKFIIEMPTKGFTDNAKIDLEGVCNLTPPVVYGCESTKKLPQ